MAGAVSTISASGPNPVWRTRHVVVGRPRKSRYRRHPMTRPIGMRLQSTSFTKAHSPGRMVVLAMEFCTPKHRSLRTLNNTFAWDSPAALSGSWMHATPREIRRIVPMVGTASSGMVAVSTPRPRLYCSATTTVSPAFAALAVPRSTTLVLSFGEYRVRALAFNCVWSMGASRYGTFHASISAFRDGRWRMCWTPRSVTSPSENRSRYRLVAGLKAEMIVAGA